MLRKILLITLVLSFCFSEENTERKETDFPKVKIQNLKGRSVFVHDVLDNKLTLVNFWATWCVPCLKEMKYLNQFHTTYSEQGFQVIGISIDDTRSSRRVPSVLKSKKVDYPVLLDTEQLLFNRFQSSAMPFSVLVSADGKILWEHTGYIPGDEKKMEEVILSYLTDTNQETPAEENDETKDTQVN